LPCQESNQNSSVFPKKELNEQENASIESPFTLEGKKNQDKEAALQTNTTFC